MAILFSLCAGLQVNDPDPMRWMAFYGASAISAALLQSRRVFAIPAAILGFAAASWGIYLFKQVKGVLVLSDLWMKMSEKGGAVEVGREAGGLAIVAVFLLLASGYRSLKA